MKEEWPELTNNSLAYILELQKQREMALVDAKTENSGVSESTEKNYYGLNVLNTDLTMPHVASVGTSIAGTIVTLLIIYGIYVLLRWLWRRHEAQKERRRQAMISSLQVQLGQHSDHNAAMQAARAAMQGASHIPGVPGNLAGAAAAALNHMGAQGTQASAPPMGAASNTTYPILPGFAK